MKIYQAKISYMGLRRATFKCVWTSVEKYPTREQAQAVVDVNVTNLIKEYKIIYSTVIEGEQEDTMVIEGLIGDNGGKYEDYSLTIQEEGKIENICMDSIIENNYKGRKVRITVELLD